ncbi:Carboxylesterase, type B [hydrothermal vent metagenome]|uniref:Carboxylesterase, type B n=1 Tax=hydrothermal vent metagenome TaxID=652676 RepID=A0A3B0T774_9ZZZZ
MKQFLPIAAALMLAACGQADAPAAAPAVPDEATVRVIAGGEIIGLTTAAGAHAWRAIPFAAPPVGDLRWRAPRAPQGWQGRRDATAFSARCAQMSNALNASEGLEPGLFIGAEDCLTLDIYAPPDAQDKKLPVMVWIHGGSNVWGRSSSYDGSKLALKEDVIIVPVQYRLGPFGWFANGAMRDSAETPEDAAANFALLDLMASLRWVRENIEAFGGDPANITIFGESAGGHNVAALLASPLAEGLFDRAIIQSGSFDSVPLAEAEFSGAPENNPSAVVAARLGTTDAAGLRGVSAEALLGAYSENGRGRLALATVIEDGVTLPSYPLREAFAIPGAFHAVPIITGTNRDEMKFFHIANPALTKKILGVFLAPRDKDYYNAVSEYLSRIWGIRSVDQPAALMAAAGHEDVYAYRFDWDEGGRFLFTDTGQLLGASHAMEIPFVFNRFVLFGKLDKILFNKKTAQTREELAIRMGSYWAEFARAGAPGVGGKDLPWWPKWSTAGGMLMRFDSAADSGDIILRKVATFDDLTADLKADPRLSADERCKIVEAVRGWLDGVATAIGEEVGCAANPS